MAALPCHYCLANHICISIVISNVAEEIDDQATTPTLEEQSVEQATPALQELVEDKPDDQATPPTLQETPEPLSEDQILPTISVKRSKSELKLYLH